MKFVYTTDMIIYKYIFFRCGQFHRDGWRKVLEGQCRLCVKDALMPLVTAIYRTCSSGER